MQYIVVKPFSDLQDGGYIYNVGDMFPREGLEVSEERIKQLSTVNNNARQVFIKKVKEEGESLGQKPQGSSEAGRQKGPAFETEQAEEKEVSDQKKGSKRKKEQKRGE